MDGGYLIKAKERQAVDKWVAEQWNLLEIVIHTHGEINVKLSEKVLHAFVNITDHLDLTVSSRLIHKVLPVTE